MVRIANSGVESWLYSLLPVSLHASFFSATYSGRVLSLMFPGRTQCKVPGFVNGGGDKVLLKGEVDEGSEVAQRFTKCAGGHSRGDDIHCRCSFPGGVRTRLEG